jgi:predicted Holliday junction resolvase-like endonuclease
MKMKNTYLIIIIVLLLSLAGAVARIYTLQGKLYEAEIMRTRMEQERIEAERKREELAEKNLKDFFKASDEEFKADERLNKGILEQMGEN